MITLALRDVCLHAPRGRYVVTYDGDGEIDFGMDATPVAFQKGERTWLVVGICWYSCS